MYNKKPKKMMTGGELAMVQGALSATDKLYTEVGDTLGLEDDSVDVMKSSRLGALGTGYGVARKALLSNRNRRNAALNVQQMSDGGQLRELDLPSHSNGGGNIGAFGLEDNVNPIAELELDETIYNNEYVFSDRLRSEDGSTFAEKSKKIKKKYKNNNPDSKATLKVLMDDLKIEQEGARILSEQQSIPRKMEYGGPFTKFDTFSYNDSLLLDEPEQSIKVDEPTKEVENSKTFSFFDDIADEETTPALIGKGIQAGIQALQAIKPAEQQNLYLNPEADNVRRLSNNRIDMQQAFNDQDLAYNAGRNSILDNARGDGNVLSNLQALSANRMRSRGQLSLNQQQIDSELRLQNAGNLNNLGQQEAQARLIRADIQSANDARRRDSVRALGATVGNAGTFITNKKVNDLRGNEVLRLLNLRNENFETVDDIKDYKKATRDSNGKLIKYKK